MPSLRNIIATHFTLPKDHPSRESLGHWLIFPFIALIILTQDRFAITLRFFENKALLAHFRGMSMNELIFRGQIYCVICTFFLFVVLPVLYEFLFPTRSKNPFGLQMRGTLPHYPPYIFLLACMVPALWVLSYTEHFNRFYPLYDPSTLQRWMIYESIYLCGFFSIEFFFRGFMLMRLEKIIGNYAVAAMTIPYAFVHIHKPFPEAVGSIVAGLILGSLALRSRSIWPGLMVHAGVAFCMDFFALLHSGRWALLH